MSEIRSSEKSVKEIIDTALTVEEITPFLMAANQLISDTLTNSGYGVDMLRTIETWLAAHFVAIRDTQLMKEKIGDGDFTYALKIGTGLNATQFGQQVQILDHKGILAEISAGDKGAADIKALP